MASTGASSSKAKPAAGASAAGPQSVADRAQNLIKQSQFIWFLGHELLLLASFFLLVRLVLGRTYSYRAYRVGFVGALVSYSVVIATLYKSKVKREGLNRQLAIRLWQDENVQYLLLALFWLVSRPVTFALVPFATYSLFHTLTYIRNHVIPTFVPDVKDNGSATAQSSPAGKASVAINNFVKSNYEAAMQKVSFFETVILSLRLILGFLFRANSFMAVIFYVSFLRFRWATSRYTRSELRKATLKVDHFLGDARVPEGVRTAWKMVKSSCETYLGVPGAAPTTNGQASTSKKAE